MAEWQIQLDAPIIPNSSLGGLMLRTKLIDIQDSVMYLGLSKTGSAELMPPFEARYSFGDGEVAVCVDVRNGKIFKLIAEQNYIGLVQDKIGIGMVVRDAMALEPALYYDGFEEAILWKGCPGIQLDISEIDPPEELVPETTITAISIFVAEIDSPECRHGTW